MRGAEKTEYFHICTDGRLLAWMFQDDKDFIAGMNRIAICHIKTMAIVLCFVLMDNHVHLLIYSENIHELSKVMQRINISYAIFFNKSKERVGYVFRNRFESIPIEMEKIFGKYGL